MKKVLSSFLALVMVFSLSGLAYAAAGVDEPGVAGIFIDATQNITLNPVELSDMQQNGLVIPVTGYTQYISAADKGNNPKLSELLVKGQIWDAVSGDWADDSILINWSTALLSTDIRDGLKGREFTDSAFSKVDWKIMVTGQYRVHAYAKFTAGAEPTAEEEFTVELVSPAITVSPMAAPNIAGIILEKEGMNPNQSTGKGKAKVQLNLISEVAHHMGPQTLFDRIEKSITVAGAEVCNPDYWQAVLNFLNKYGFNFTYTLDDYIQDLGGGDDTPVLPATSNWTMLVDLSVENLVEYSVVMNVDGSTISGTITQSGSLFPCPFSGTLVGQKFTGTYISTMGLPYVGAIEWTFNAAFDGFTGDFWYANDTGNPKAYYAGAITDGTLVP